MGILDDAIREHLELKRRQGVEDTELARLEDEAFGPPSRPGDPDFPEDTSGDATETAVAEPPPAEMSEPPPEPALADAEAPDEAPTELAAPVEPEAGGFYDQTSDEFDLELDLEAADEPAALAEPPAPAEAAAEAPAPPEPAAEPEPPEPPPAPEAAEPAAEVAPPSPPPEPSQPPIESLDTVEHTPAFEPPIESLDTVEHHFEDAIEDTGEAEALQPPPPETGEAEVVEGPIEDTGEVEVVEGEIAEDEGEEEDVLEETPEFLRDQPEDDELWFEQGEPKDFDF